MVAQEPTKWTKEQDDILRQMWGVDGASAQECAAQIGKSRNAVIGRAGRLGIRCLHLLRRRGPNLGPSKPRGPRRRPAELVKPKYRMQCVADCAEHGYLPSEDCPNCERVPINQAPTLTVVPVVPFVRKANGEGGCQWPFGESPDWYFCGEQKINGSSYCLEHYVIAYQPSRSR